MTTLGNIVEALMDCGSKRRKAALATVIETQGSVYRRAGARCLVLEDGTTIGVVSGGCVESELFDHAEEAWSSRAGKQLFYDFRGEDDELWGMGKGCQGAVTLWLQPLLPVEQPEAFDAVLSDLTRRNTTSASYLCALVVASDDEEALPVGTVREVDAATVNAHVDRHQCGRSPEAVVDWQRPVVADLVIEGVKARVFLEPVKPRPRLVVYGAGEDARVLTETAHFLDWHVTVIDHRPLPTTPTRFPQVEDVRLIKRDDYEKVVHGPNDYVVVMTHNYEVDLRILRTLLPTSLPYIGLLGPTKRRERLIGDLRQEGLALSSQELAKLYSPIGLDVGAETPEEIATSIVAEMVAHRNGRNGGMLRERESGIHD